jgi:hypothetical protein
MLKSIPVIVYKVVVVVGVNQVFIFFGKNIGRTQP